MRNTRVKRKTNYRGSRITGIEDYRLNNDRATPPFGSLIRLQQDIRPKRRSSSLKWILIIAAIVIVVGLGVLFAFLFLNRDQSANSGVMGSAEIASISGEALTSVANEIRLMEAISAGAAVDDPDVLFLPTPLIACYGDLYIHSSILPRDLTEIEFHQASYDTSLSLTPLLTIVDAQEVADKQGTNHIPYEDQPFGNRPLIAEAVSTWRLNSIGGEMTSVDVGALAGTVVYAPVTGTVVKIKQYSLYGIIDDYEMHIQSPDHPELDIVVLHIDQLTVKVGDKVFGGCTRIATVRNIGDVIDNNLANFTADGDKGNHCHVQVNDATREDYPGLEGALDIFNGQGYVRPEPAPEAT